jgi:hypothetical protein
LPFNVTLPIPFGVKLKSMFVSLPVTETLGALVVAALATVISFTAEAVFVNLIYSLLESSSIAPALSITISLPLVSNTADNVGAASFDNFPIFESATSVPFTYKIFEPLSVAEKAIPV